jgi:hypothetical protein
LESVGVTPPARRPHRARRALWTVVKLGVGWIVLSTVLGVGAFAASSLYQQYGSPRTPVSVQDWAQRPQTYLATDCRGCHGDQAAQARSGAHHDLICETCHVPAVDHPGPVVGVVQALPAATSSLCISCHAQIAGTPAGWAQVALARHYAGADCIACHEPHASVAVAPREVTHPLANLPACSTCHAPGGLKQFPANHDTAPDAICLACHRPGAGP